MGKIRPQHVVAGVGMAVRAYGALNSMTASNAPAPALPPPPLPDPMAGFAKGRELDAYRLREGAFFMGRIHSDHGTNFPAGLSDDRHIFIVAQTRGGKDLTLAIPNALLWPGPLFGIDPKGEMASIAALRRASVDAAKGTGTRVRRFIGQRVAILDPLGEVRGPARAFRVDYNPLSDIDLNRGGGVRDIHAAAASIIRQEPGDAAHFSESAATVAAGVIEAVKMREPADRQTLPHVREIMLMGRAELCAYLDGIDTGPGLAVEALRVIEEVGAKEWGSFRSTLSRNFRWLAEPDMARHLGPSSFSLRRAMQEGWSVFVVLPPTEMVAFASWLRLVVRQALQAKIALGPYQTGPQTLCLLNEFPTLGNFKIIEESGGYLAGYGLKLVPIIQNIGQLKTIYARNWETFLGNAGAIIGFSLNDHDSENYIATRLGRLLVEESGHSTSSGRNAQFMAAGGTNYSTSYNTARHERPVRFANEIHAQAARETGRAFVISASGRAFTIERMPYTSFPADLYDSPASINDWETRFWEGKLS